jgi:hypothetical protein
MYPNNTLMFPYPDSKPTIVDPNMWYNCENSTTGFEVFTVKQSDGWVAFNLLVSTRHPASLFLCSYSEPIQNSGALWDLRVSIDSHKMYFCMFYLPDRHPCGSLNTFFSDAADGHYTKIQVANSILIPIGERYQFFVKLDQTAGDYVIRTAAVVLPQILTGYSILSYTSTGTTGSGLETATTLPASKNPVSNYIVIVFGTWAEGAMGQVDGLCRQPHQ